MTSLVRKLQKIFATSATSDVRNFGGLAAGSMSYSQDPDVIQSLGAFLTGWKAAVVGNHSPALQDFDSLFYLLTYQLAYLTQRGIPQYLATQTYDQYDVCLDPAGTGIYVSQQTNNTGNALNNPTWWLSLQSIIAPAKAQCKAWVRFNGLTGAMIAGYNVSSVTRNSAGNYTVNFTTALGDANPAWAGVASMVGRGTTTSSLQEVSASASHINIQNVNQNSGSAVDATTVCLQVFSD